MSDAFHDGQFYERKPHVMDAFWSARECGTENELIAEIKQRLFATDDEAVEAILQALECGLIEIENGKIVKPVKN
jgi:hypothetical protein